MTSTTTSLFFGQFLTQRKIPYQTQTNGNLTIYIIERTIQHGKYAGTTVTIGLPIPSDFEVNPPYGIHIKKQYNVMQTVTQQSASVLGGEWEFWSRQVKNWNATANKPQYYLDHVDRWLDL